jgi:putative spermidine/putrescine transport system permease protein
MKREWWLIGLLVPAAAVSLSLVVWPVLELGLVGFSGASTLSFTSVLSLLRALSRTVWVAAVTTGLSVVLGGCLAVVTWQVRNRVTRVLLLVSALLPLWLGVVVKNYAFVLLMNRNGVANWILNNVFGIGWTIDVIYTERAVVVGMVYSMLPYAFSLVYAALLRFDRRLLEASSASGACGIQSAVYIALPQLAPSLIVTTAVIFNISLGFYVTPIILGGAHLSMLASEIDRLIFLYFDRAGAAVASLTVLIGGAVPLAVALGVARWLAIRVRA